MSKQDLLEGKIKPEGWWKTKARDVKLFFVIPTCGHYTKASS
jgi:hypothetical protein